MVFELISFGFFSLLGGQNVSGQKSEKTIMEKVGTVQS